MGMPISKNRSIQRILTYFVGEVSLHLFLCYLFGFSCFAHGIIKTDLLVSINQI